MKSQRILPARPVRIFLLASAFITVLPASSGIHAAPRQAVASGKVSPRWGFYAQLAGTAWIDEKAESLYVYDWDKRDEALSVVILAPEDTYRNKITLSDNGPALLLRTSNNPSSLEMLADGSFVQPNGGDKRVRYRFEKGVLTLTEEALGSGGWQATGESRTRRRLNETELAIEKRVLEARREAVAQRIAHNWGVMPQLAGQRFLYISDEYPQYSSVTDVEWLKRGSDALIKYTYLGKDSLAGWTRLSQDPATGKTIAQNNEGGRGTFDTTIDGHIRVVWDESPKTKNYGVLTHEYYLTAGGLVTDSYFMKKGKKRYETNNVYPMVTGQDNQTLRLAVADRQNKLKAQRQAEAQAKAEKKGGGLLGGLMGAIGGAAAGAAFGGDTGTILGAAAKGAAIVDPGSAASGALNIVGDSMMGGATGGSSLAGIAGTSAAAGGASYPTRPNALSGSSACAMMNEGNYRQVGVEGGRDVQLKTMCAQAYEYYVMYKRAIAQGYSEADANRTYDAHQQAAQNAMSFYANNRAD